MDDSWDEWSDSETDTRTTTTQQPTTTTTSQQTSHQQPLSPLPPPTFTPITSTPLYARYKSYIKSLQSSLSSSLLPSSLTSHFASHFTSPKVLSIRSYHNSNPSLYAYTLTKELPRLSYTFNIEKPPFTPTSTPSTYTTPSSLRYPWAERGEQRTPYNTMR